MGSFLYYKTLKTGNNKRPSLNLDTMIEIVNASNIFESGPVELDDGDIEQYVDITHKKTPNRLLKRLRPRELLLVKVFDLYMLIIFIF